MTTTNYNSCKLYILELHIAFSKVCQNVYLFYTYNIRLVILTLSSSSSLHQTKIQVGSFNPFILKNMILINLEKFNLFSFRLITSPSQLSYVSVTVKRNLSSKHGIINRLNIPYKSTKSCYLVPTKDYIKSTKLMITYQMYSKYLTYNNSKMKFVVPKHKKNIRWS